MTDEEKSFDSMSDDEKKASNKKAYREMDKKDKKRNPDYIDTSEWEAKFERNRG